MLLAVALFLVCLAVLAVLVWRAPQGYEDRRGFHYGPDPELTALSHCLDCACWISAPCSWERCPFRLVAREDDHRPASGPEALSHEANNA